MIMYMRITIFTFLLLSITLTGCSDLLGGKAKKWAKLDQYQIGDLIIEAPRGMIDGYIPMPSDLIDHNYAGDGPHPVRNLAFEIYGRNIDFGVRWSEICEAIRDSWSRDLCMERYSKTPDLPTDFEYQDWAHIDLLKSHGKITDSVYDHISSMSFDDGPLQIACDRKFPGHSRAPAKRCTVVLLTTPKVFVIWRFSYRFVPNVSLQEASDKVCAQARSLHVLWIEFLEISPIYGVDPPTCPNKFTTR